MDNKKSAQYCRVCGIFHGTDLAGNDYFPWGEDDNSPTFHFCECCGVEFGYEDCCIEWARSFREEWLEKGSKWSSPEMKPDNWSLKDQLKNIPEKYL